MNIEAINKWLDEEYGCSFTRLEELHDYYFEKYCDLQQENKELIKEKIRLLVIIQKALNTNVINSEDMKFITKLHKELGSGINE